MVHFAERLVKHQQSQRVVVAGLTHPVSLQERRQHRDVKRRLGLAARLFADRFRQSRFPAFLVDVQQVKIQISTVIGKLQQVPLQFFALLRRQFGVRCRDNPAEQLLHHRSVAGLELAGKQREALHQHLVHNHVVIFAIGAVGGHPEPVATATERHVFQRGVQFVDLGPDHFDILAQLADEIFLELPLRLFLRTENLRLVFRQTSLLQPGQFLLPGGVARLGHLHRTAEIAVEITA